MVNLKKVLIIDTANLEPYIVLGQIDLDGVYQELKRRQIPANRCAELLVNSIAELINSPDVLVVNLGPGSWTGIRIGLTVAKTMAWNLSIPIVGVHEINDAWPRIRQNEFDDVYALKPFYEKEPNITTPKNAMI